MGSKIAATIGRVNALAMAPFQATIPIKPLALTFLLVLIVALQWRLIVDKIEEYEP